MNLKVEEILMVVIAFLSGWFLKTMIQGRLVEGQGGIIKDLETLSDLDKFVYR
jgi:hypothetical protein